MDIKLRVTASGAVVIQDPDGVVIEEGGGVSETASALAPLPVIGLGASYAITPKLFLRAKGELFALRFGDYKGALFDGILAMDYDLTKNFGVGAAFNLVNIGVEATADEFVGSLDYRYDSLLIYARLFM